MKNIAFTMHSLSKIEILKRHGFSIKWSLVIDILRNPGRIHPGYGNRLAVERVLNKKVMIRIIFSECNNYIKVITLYPSRRSKSERKICL